MWHDLKQDVRENKEFATWQSVTKTTAEAVINGVNNQLWYTHPQQEVHIEIHAEAELRIDVD